jgi:outer membrane receptor protein involved in Fe transport
VTGPTTADIGNPQLRPEQTLSIEAGGQLSVSGQQLSATLYSRRRSDTRDTAVAITGDGQILAIPVNSGSRLSRGGQVSVRGRLSPDLRYSASAWAAQAAFNRLEGSAILRDSALEYGGNAQLEYSDGKAGKRGYDHLVLNIRYFGPTRYLQIAAEDFLTVEISHTHYLTDRLALVGTASNFFGDRIVVSERTAPAFVERSSSELHGPLFRISLTYDLGR